MKEVHTYAVHILSVLLGFYKLFSLYCIIVSDIGEMFALQCKADAASSVGYGGWQYESGSVCCVSSVHHHALLSVWSCALQQNTRSAQEGAWSVLFLFFPVAIGGLSISRPLMC